MNTGVARGPRAAGCLSLASEPPYHCLPPAAWLSAVQAPRWRQRPPGLCAGRTGSVSRRCATWKQQSWTRRDLGRTRRTIEWGTLSSPGAYKRYLEFTAQAILVLKRSCAPPPTPCLER